MIGKILLIDDEINVLKVLSANLRSAGYEVFTAMSAEEALQKLTNISPDCIIADYKLPGMSGVDFIEILKKRAITTPIIVLTAYGSIEKAVDAMKKGAFNYLTKPVNIDELLTVTSQAIDKHRLQIENIQLKNQLKERHSYKNIIGKSKAMQEVFKLIELVAMSSSNVLIIGQSGTGKELIAKAIHYASARAKMPFVTIDCAALPEELLLSELFGHEKGSFTGAYEQRVGQIELADKGTVFLDEIGELSPAVQSKFLRFLQERDFLRVGGRQRIKVDVRVIAATNKDLADLVQKGAFREDLFYRLNVVTIKVPALKDRKEDIILLANHFLNKFNEQNKKHIKEIDPEVINVLLDYSWPGNVRELENVIERAVVLCTSETITLHYLPKGLRELNTPPPTTVLNKGNLLETERQLILSALQQTNWNQTKAAEILGITRKQLRTKMKNHNLLTTADDAD